MFDIVATFLREFELEEMIIGTQVLVTKIWATRNQSLLPFIDFLWREFFDSYVLWPFDKKFIFELLKRINTRDYTEDFFIV